MADINSNEDLLTSEDIITRHEELKERNDFWSDAGAILDIDNHDTDVYLDGALSETEAEELAELDRLVQQGELFEEWEHGVTLIRDSYFTRYAKELADELGIVGQAQQWPFTHIDWEAAAEALQSDYTDIDYNGVTYWAR